MKNVFLFSALLLISSHAFALMEFYEGECTYQCTSGPGSSQAQIQSASHGGECFQIASDFCGKDNFKVHYEAEKFQTATPVKNN